MQKYFKPAVEEKLMKKVVLPIESKFPGATYPYITYDYPYLKKPAEQPKKTDDEHAKTEIPAKVEPKTEEKKKDKKKKKKH